MNVQTNRQTADRVHVHHVYVGLAQAPPNSVLNYVINFGILTILLLQLIGSYTYA